MVKTVNQVFMKKMLLIFLVFFFTFISKVSAQDGSPDLSYGDNGIVISDIGVEGIKYISSVDQGPDNRIIVSGEVYNTVENRTDNFIIAYLEDGIVDTNFAVEGIYWTNGTEESNIGITVLSNNKILVKSRTVSAYVIKRLMPNGEIDTEFADNGYLQPFADEVFIQKIIDDEIGDFKVLGINREENEPILLIKSYDLNGQLDTTFATNGLFSQSLGNINYFYVSTFVEHEDSIYLNVTFFENEINLSYILKISSNGEQDTSFGIDGKVTIPLEPEFITYFTIFNNGKFLVGGSYYDDNIENYVKKTIKMNTDGTLDTSFGNSGSILGITGGNIQQNDRFIASTSYSDFEGGITLNYSRYFADGTIDDSFNFNANYSALNSGHFLTLNDGNFLVVGADIWYNGEPYNIILQRFSNSPLGISEFNTPLIKIFPNPSTGIFTLESNSISENTNYQITDASGKIVQIGNLETQQNQIDLSSAQSGVYFLRVGNSVMRLLKN